MPTFLEEQLWKARRKSLVGVVAFFAVGSGAAALLVGLYLLEPDIFLEPGRHGDPGGIIYLFMGVIVGIGGTVILTIQYFYRLFASQNHKLMQTLKEFGNLEMVVAAIDEEELDAFFLDDEALVTRSWIVQLKRNKWMVARMNEIRWVYRDYRRLMNSSRGRGRHVIFLYSDNGDQFEIRSDADEIEDVFTAIRGHVPNAHVGFDELLEELWDDDLEEFLDCVDRKVRRRPRLPVEAPPPPRAPQDRDEPSQSADKFMDYERS